MFLTYTISFDSYAALAPESVSDIDGYFMGFTDVAYFSPDMQSKHYIQEIRAICDKKVDFWAFKVNTPFQCQEFNYLPNTGVVEVIIKSKEKINKYPHALLFSLKPFRNEIFLPRVVSVSERKNITSLLSAKKNKYKLAIKSIVNNKAQAIDAKNSTIFIIPTKVIIDSSIELSNQYYLAVIKEKSNTYISGEFNGKIIGFTDVNNDGFPDVQVSENCDGTCEAIISLNKEIKQIISISSH